MTTTLTTQSSTQLQVFRMSGLLARAAGVIAAFYRGYCNRCAFAALGEVSDHVLADIGLTRDDVRDAFSEPLWRDPTSLMRRRAIERQRAR